MKANDTENAINAFIDWCNGETSYFDNSETKQFEHGKVIDFKMEAYHDVIIYEDGHEERFYICD